MSEIVQELTIEATPENVFHALTRPVGIAGWWSNQVTAEPKVGSLTEVLFENGGVFQMEITDLEVGKKVHWSVKLSPHDWEGVHDHLGYHTDLEGDQAALWSTCSHDGCYWL